MELNRYDRATVALWQRGHTALRRGHVGNWLAMAACHAVLARLRDCRDASALLRRYERDPSADFALMASVVGMRADLTSETLWMLRDAAYFLRWDELLRGRS